MQTTAPVRANRARDVQWTRMTPRALGSIVTESGGITGAGYEARPSTTWSPTRPTLAATSKLDVLLYAISRKTPKPPALSHPTALQITASQR